MHTPLHASRHQQCAHTGLGSQPPHQQRTDAHERPDLRAQVEEFADKQKELESTIQPIMTRLYQGAPSAADLLTTVC